MIDVTVGLEHTGSTRAADFPPEDGRAAWMAVWIHSKETLGAVSLRGELADFDRLIAELQRHRDAHAAYLREQDA